MMLIALLYLIPEIKKQVFNLFDVLKNLKSFYYTNDVNIPHNFFNKIFNNINLSQYMSFTATGIVASTKGIFMIIFNCIFGPFISLYFFSSSKKITQYFKTQISFPEYYQTIILNLISYIQKIINIFITGQLIIVLLSTLYYCVIFYFVEIKNFLILGMICGLAVILPYIGTFLSLLIVFLVVICQHGISIQLFLVIGGFTLGHVLEMLFLTPYFVGTKLGLHPILAIAGLFLNAAIFGPWGMVIALPITVILCDLVLLTHSYLWYNIDLSTYKSSILK